MARKGTHGHLAHLLTEETEFGHAPILLTAILDLGDLQARLNVALVLPFPIHDMTVVETIARMTIRRGGGTAAALNHTLPATHNAASVLPATREPGLTRDACVSGQGQTSRTTEVGAEAQNRRTTASVHAAEVLTVSIATPIRTPNARV